jgi:metacaspase-1
VRRYLCVGINAYAGQELQGCVNDADDWSSALADRGYVGTVLTDTDATRANITAELRDLLVSARRGDTVVFQYSGHGTWLPDADGDEADGRDEALVPVDYDTAGLIVDDDLYRLVNDNRGSGVKALFVSDSCFSGTVTRAVAANSQKGAVRRGKARYLPPANFLSPANLETASRVQYTPKNTTSRTGAALLSGCRDDQVSYDAWFADRANGAFTRAAVDALTRTDPHNLTAWMNEIHKQITYDQDPQVSGTWWQKHMTRFV